MLHRLGIRGHLITAFLSISFFAVLAAGVALYSFLEVGRSLERVSHREVPHTIDSMEIGRLAQRMVNAAPAMLTVSTAAQLDQIQSSIEADGQRIDERLGRLKANAAGDKTLLTMEWILGQLRSNVGELHDVIAHRSRISAARSQLQDEFHAAYSAIGKILSEEIALLDIRIEQLSLEDAKDQALPTAQHARARLQAVDRTVASIYGVFLEARLAENQDSFASLLIRGQFALGGVDALVAGSEQPMAQRLAEHNTKLHDAIEGPSNVFVLLGHEFDATAKARDILTESGWLSEELSGEVDELVGGAKGEITNAIVKAERAQQLSTWIILVIVALSVVCSTLVVWLYVGRRIIARLIGLTDCMESVASGDLKIDLPESRGDDEIDRMTRALRVFRDTAVEIEERNLRDIAQTRQRLMDAIESISEGFCCFDANDRLVVANRRFRELIYPGDEGAIVEGMRFEKLIRQAAEQGHIKGAENRVDAWGAAACAGIQQWTLGDDQRTADQRRRHSRCLLRHYRAEAARNGSRREVTLDGEALKPDRQIPLASDLRLDFCRQARGEGGKPAPQAHDLLFRHCRIHGDRRAARIRRTHNPPQPLPHRDVADCDTAWGDDRQICRRRNRDLLR
jgi:HAMP domain-containing protein